MEVAEEEVVGGVGAWSSIAAAMLQENISKFHVSKTMGGWRGAVAVHITMFSEVIVTRATSIGGTPFRNTIPIE